jgi:hypothetical protein
MYASNSQSDNIHVCNIHKPVTVAEQSKACTVYARSEPGFMGSNPTKGMDVWCLCVYAFFCVSVQVEERYAVA